jgi:CHAD domain-containing protein
MLSKSSQKQYLKKRTKKLLRSYHLFNEFEHPEDLHKMRLEMKKISSFVLFLNLINKNSKLKKQLKSIRPVFKKAGLVRVAQLNLNLAEKFELADIEIIEMQSAVLDNHLMEFRMNYYDNTEKLSRSLKKIHREISRIKGKDIKSFYKNQVNVLAELLNSDEMEEKLHECRKRIKNLIYTYRFMPSKLKDKVYLNVEYLDELQEQIGDWHDIDETILLFEKNDTKFATDIALLRIHSEIKLEEILRIVKHFKIKVKAK